VDQAQAQDFVEDLNPSYTSRTQDERFMQREEDFLTSSPSQDATETVPVAIESIPSSSLDHVFAISDDVMEPSSSPNSISQDLSTPLFTGIFQEFVDTSNAVLKSTKFQVHDFPATVQATSSPQAAAGSVTNASDEDAQISAQPYQVAFFTAPMISVESPPKHFIELTMHATTRYNCIFADPHFAQEKADGDTPSTLPKPLPDPTSPENFGNPEEVSVYMTKQPKPASHLVCHALSNQMRFSASPALKSSHAIVL